jgi:release factor glutamine methyltransferase
MTPSSSTTISNWLKSTTAKFTKASIKSARLDALILLENVIQKDRSYLLSHPEQIIKISELKTLASLVDRRLKYEPVAYIRGFSEFYGRKFLVNNSVLIPRPESESFIDLALQLSNQLKTVADVGSGSGALGLTIKLELPDVNVDLIENSLPALKVSKLNAKNLNAKVNIAKSNLFEAANGKYDLVVANLPYLPDDFKFDPATKYEPSRALLGGPDGLSIYRKLWDEIKTRKAKPAIVLTESLHFQHLDLENMANHSGYSLVKTDNLVQQFTLDR